MSQLDQLAQHRDAILLAEAIGWLHDYRKCSEEQLQAQPTNTTAQGIPRNEVTNRFPSLTSTNLLLPSVSELIPNLLNNWKGKWSDHSVSYLMQYLSRCHNTAHFDKQEPFDSGKQNYPGTQISTAFGFETAIVPNLTNQLWVLPWNNLTTYTNNRNHLLTTVQPLFTMAGADTRRPINEVSLWDWGLLVGALYKSAIAATIIGHQSATHDLRWRLLSIRTDGLTYLTSASRLPDLFGRQKTLQTALDNAQILLEETYPLATEVYRDENGALYVVPNLPDLFDLQDGNNQTLLTHIRQQFATDGEIVPQITLDPNAWWGQDPDRRGNDEIPPAGSMLSAPTTLQSDAGMTREAWGRGTEQICPICGLRPCVNRQLDYCQICVNRRKGRVVEWLQDQSKTIWLDEVADHNGRLALITGTFDLTNWLDGSLVETLLVREPGNSNLAVTKNPSFARLRRIWQTTQTFWERSQYDTNQLLTDARRRLIIQLSSSPSLSQNQTYKLDLHGQTRMSVLWDGAHLISIDNLSYTAAKLNIKAEKRKTPANAALAVGVWLDEERKQNTFQLISDDEKNKQFDVQIADVDYQDAAYATAIPILAEPRTFMALVPADKALEVVETIRAKYEREMGKVRNRLPLHLGIVYAQRRTPLRAILDAGRRMLKQKGEVAGWQVVCSARRSLDDEDVLPERFEVDKEGQFKRWLEVTLERDGQRLIWYVPAVMGDGQTEDNWYPYVFVKNDVSDRQRIFKGVRPVSDGTKAESRLIHAAKLQTDDQIYFTPATLDFQWLDSAARRFEIAYNENGRRRGHLTRPYLLDELETINKAWELVSNSLTSNQIYILRDLVETKRENWQPTTGELEKEAMFRQFCRDAATNANWKWKKELTKEQIKEQINQLTDWLVSGLFSDMVQLYMGIMKEKPKGEENNERTD